MQNADARFGIGERVPRGSGGQRTLETAVTQWQLLG